MDPSAVARSVFDSNTLGRSGFFGAVLNRCSWIRAGGWRSSRSISAADDAAAPKGHTEG